MDSRVAGVESVERVVGELNENDLVRPSNALEADAQYKAALEASLAEETNRNLELQRRCDEACAEVVRFKCLLPDAEADAEADAPLNFKSWGLFF